MGEYSLEKEQRFEPPHKTEISDITADSHCISFTLSDGRQINMRGTLRFKQTQFDTNEDVPVFCSGVFEGTYTVDDFSYQVEIHFRDTTGIIYECPSCISGAFWATDYSTVYIELQDQRESLFLLVREPGENWDLNENGATGRVGHRLCRF